MKTHPTDWAGAEGAKRIAGLTSLVRLHNRGDAAPGAPIEGGPSAAPSIADLYEAHPMTEAEWMARYPPTPVTDFRGAE